MKNLNAGIVASVIAGLVAGQIVAAEPDAKTKTATKTPATKTTTDAVLKDIEATVGFVPQFFRPVPHPQPKTFWASMKTFEMNPNTALDAKTKELIGLGVAAQIPCEYCVQFHTQTAKAAGATDQEIREAVGMAAQTRLGSTVLNGMQVDRAQFKADLQRMAKETPKKQQATR